MNWVDWVWLVAGLTGLLSGLRGGLLSETLRTASWVVIAGAVLKFGPTLQPFPLAGVTLGLLVVAWIIRKLVCKIAGPPGWISRLAGLVVGGLRVGALLIFLTLGVARLQSDFWNRPVCVESRCGATVLQLFGNGAATNQIQRTI